ncbi:MAG: hypothetical protein AAF944_01870 [Bacteroidota bacterium]
MKRVLYLSFALLTLFIWGCSEDEAAETPSFLSLEERVINNTSFSFFIRAAEGAGNGTVHFLILDKSDPAPTTSDIRSNSATTRVSLSGGGTTIGSTLGVSPNTTYMVYAFMEVDGVEGELVSLEITTDA